MMAEKQNCEALTLSIKRKIRTMIINHEGNNTQNNCEVYQQ